MNDLLHQTSSLTADTRVPRLVATTHASVHPSQSSESSDFDGKDARASTGNDTAIFKNAQLSPDGTTMLTSSEDRKIRSYILPIDLLNSTALHALSPYYIHETPSPVYATTIHPWFGLSSPSTALFLASPASLPIRLLSPFSPSIIASYPLVHAPTESYLAPHSLLFTSNPNHFLAGADSLISRFDISRPSSSPINTLPTIPSKRKVIVGGGVGMKGIVSAMALTSEGVLAAGTFTGWLGLYDSEGVGDTIGVFRLHSPGEEGGDGHGDGVTSLAWSSCGRYLVVAERGSDGMGVWDIRGTGRRLAWLVGRKAETMQRLGIATASLNIALQRNSGAEVTKHIADTEYERDHCTSSAPCASGGESVWAGGTDGCVREWPSLGKREGKLMPAWTFKAHTEAVSAVNVHPYASVLATCSGQRYYTGTVGSPREDKSDSEEDGNDAKNIINRRSRDRSLKIWALEAQ